MYAWGLDVMSTLMLYTHADAQRWRLRRVGKTRQSAPNVGARRLGQDEQYLTVREILSEVSTPVPPRAGLSRERSDFYRFGYATLGLSTYLIEWAENNKIHALWKILKWGEHG